MSSHREKTIIRAVECPQCHAWQGTACFVHGPPAKSAHGGPFVHPERREAWQKQRGVVPEVCIPANCPTCGKQCSSRSQAKAHCKAEEGRDPPALGTFPQFARHADHCNFLRDYQARYSTIWGERAFSC